MSRRALPLLAALLAAVAQPALAQGLGVGIGGGRVTIGAQGGSTGVGVSVGGGNGISVGANAGGTNVGATAGGSGVNVGVAAGGATVNAGAGTGGVNAGTSVGTTNVGVGVGSSGVNVGAGAAGTTVGVGVGSGGVNVGAGTGGMTGGAGVGAGGVNVGLGGAGSVGSVGGLGGSPIGAPALSGSGTAGVSNGVGAGIGSTLGTAAAGLGVQPGRAADLGSGAESTAGRGVGIRFRPSLPLSAGSRLVTLPPSLAPDGPRTPRVRVTIPEIGAVSSSAFQVQLVNSGLVPRPGTSMDIVRTCRAAAVQAAKSLPVERVDAAGAGETRETRGGYVAPIEFRILYRRKKSPGLEAKQAVSNCNLDRSGNVLALR